MKKFLSLILALLMILAISVPTLAAEIDDPYDLEMTEKSYDKLGDEGQMLPGYTYYIKLTNGEYNIDVDKRDFKIEYSLEKGSSKYVESYGLEDGDFYVTVANNIDATTDDPGYIGINITLIAKADWEKRGIEKGDEFFYNDGFDVANNIYYVETYPDAEEAEIYDGTESNTSYTAEDERGWVIFDCGYIDILMRLTSTRTVSFDPEVVKIAAIDKLAKETVPKCVTFHAQPTISGTATYMVDSDYDYVYSFDGTKLTQIKVTEDGTKNVWKMTDATLGTFVLSEESLAGTVAAEPAPAPESSAAPAPAPAPETPAPAPAPESSVTEPVEPEEPVAEPEDEPVDITPEPEVEEEPTIEPEEEEEPVVEEEPKSMLPMILLILAAATVAAILIAMLVARSGKKSRR